MIYVLKGRGATTVWYEDGRKSSFEWGAGALFAIPLNAWHQHFNASGSEPVRYIGVTSAPIAINLFGDPEFIYNCDYKFANRYAGEADYFSGDGKLTGMVWETNFVADVPSYTLLAYPERGAGGRNIKFTLAKNQMGAHVSEFPIGTYKKGHRHGPGVVNVIPAGEGYSIMWQEGKEKDVIPWHEASVFVPPNRWWHARSPSRRPSGACRRHRCTRRARRGRGVPSRRGRRRSRDGDPTARSAAPFAAP